VRQSIMAVAWRCAERNGGKRPAGRGEPETGAVRPDRPATSPGQGGGSNKCGAGVFSWQKFFFDSGTVFFILFYLIITV
jgi:hypothetical protein